MNNPALHRILSRLDERLERSPSPAYGIPGRWADPFGDPAVQSVVPERFYRDRLRDILATPPRPRVTDGVSPGDWGKNAVVYNLLVRYGAAFDHDANGSISPEPLPSAWRETGTFLKAIPLLPFIQSLGCNTVHLLPVTRIGQDGNKGNMGSAFAIRDPYALDDHLAEPALDLGAETECAAFVEAAHHLGIRVVVEFVFRTAARDSVWAQDHPEWFYWIRSDIPDRRPGDASENAFGSPVFSPDELNRIFDAVGNGRFDDLLPPHPVYRDMFAPPPPPNTVRMENGQWRGVSTDPHTGQPILVRIPGAFCDWPLNSSQPPWTDVTYLRLYEHPGFNYMAYNTLRMYDADLARPEHIVRPLWDRIVDTIPHYQTRFGIDGVMIDMGHALPADLKRRMEKRAREVNPDFALWAEDFGLNPSAREEGYNVCLGPFLQAVRQPGDWDALLRRIGESGVPVPFMATAENHNTPRAVHWPGGRAFSLRAQTLGAFLPAVPYIHNGAELAEPVPVNTGFDFTPEETAALPPSMLPLFSAAAMDWTRRDTLIDDFRRLHALRARHRELATDPSPGTLAPLFTDNPAISGYLRRHPAQPSGLAILGNADLLAGQPFAPPPGCSATDLLSGRPLPAQLAPGQVVICAMDSIA